MPSGEINEEAFWKGASPEARGRYRNLVVAGQGAYSIVARAVEASWTPPAPAARRSLRSGPRGLAATPPEARGRSALTAACSLPRDPAARHRCPLPPAAAANGVARSPVPASPARRCHRERRWRSSGSPRSSTTRTRPRRCCERFGFSATFGTHTRIRLDRKARSSHGLGPDTGAGWVDARQMTTSP